MRETIRNRSYWNAIAEAPGFPALTENLTVEVAIIGGRMVGLTPARRLKDKGITVAVIEALKVGRQVTGKSTAKITSQHSRRYTTLKKKFGATRAKIYADAQQAAITEIKRFVTRYDIDCDLEDKAAYVYT